MGDGHSIGEDGDDYGTPSGDGESATQ
jgi:hypothetical protein